MENSIVERIKGGLVVPCQILKEEPLYSSYIMSRITYMAMLSGAVGIHANTVVDIEKIKKTVSLPIIGIIKEVYGDCNVFITPTTREIEALIACGVDIIATDATSRTRPDGRTPGEFFGEIRMKYPDQLLMADRSTYEKGVHAAEIGFDFIGTTLYGYVEYTKGAELPNIDLVGQLAKDYGKPVIAEGSIWLPEQLKAAPDSGVWAAVIGGAVIEPMEITKRFAAAIQWRATMKIMTLDIGGMFVEPGIWNSARVEKVREHGTNAARDNAYVMERAKEVLHTYDGFEVIDISTTGQVSSEEGRIRYANGNIPGYTGTRIRDILTGEFEIPMTVEDDMNAAAVGESQFGAGWESDDFLYITYGTGVGGPVVMDKKIYTGSAFSAGEFGAMVLHPEDSVVGDPFRGCYERYASTTALVARAKEYNNTLDNSRAIFTRLEEEQVREIVDSWTDEIMYGLVTLIHVFNPPCVVLGGGVMVQPYILEEIRRRTAARIMSSFRNVTIKQAQLGNMADIMGVACLAGCMTE